MFFHLSAARAHPHRPPMRFSCDYTVVCKDLTGGDITLENPLRGEARSFFYS